jgi:hypothetical protein
MENKKKYIIRKFKEFAEDSEKERVEIEHKTTIKQLGTYRKRPSWNTQINPNGWWIQENEKITIQIYHPHFYNNGGDVKIWNPSYEIECEGFTGLKQALEDLEY